MFVAGKQYSTAFLWANADAIGQQLAIAAGKCSHMDSASNVISANHASLAGGAIYSTETAFLNVTCDDKLAPSLLRAGCPTWSNNTVGPAMDDAYGPTIQVLQYAYASWTVGIVSAPEYGMPAPTQLSELPDEYRLP